MVQALRKMVHASLIPRRITSRFVPLL
ncbi:hypothetical protein NECAME_16645 [Necator americanus]|uniref:Uncharacterized protein n=1 Tax=Necator americanus TaxID=51031 RepID=W2TXN6_NECAM|nr:hypothetical protein NECAME_16645 [Necator americanus]ETN85777.1 hypothetical protein NECAME_16645 [Necator americanus]